MNKEIGFQRLWGWIYENKPGTTSLIKSHKS